MSEARLLERLARPGAVLALDKSGCAYGVFASSDRRRRPQGRVTAARVEALAADGALRELEGGVYALSAAGRARAERAAAAPDEAWRAQHDELVDRPAVDRDGDLYTVRGTRAGGGIARLAKLKTHDGAAFFSADEIAAGARLAQDWAAGQQGLVRGADWSAPPRGNTQRGSGGGIELARASVIDARARVDLALTALAQPAAVLVRAACIDETGLEVIERRFHWPARSAKIAMKFALAQLAQIYRGLKWL